MKDRLILIYLTLARLFVRIVITIVGSLEIQGRENVPPAGPYIVVTNHLSKTDPPIILLVLPEKSEVATTSGLHSG